MGFDRFHISDKGRRGAAGCSAEQENGKRAVTIRVDDVRGVAGFILPNDHVDVVLARTDNQSTRKESYSELLLQNVKVLAIDQVAGEKKEQPTVAKAVTLEVTPYQAQKISLAIDVGRLSLVLRQPGEASTVPHERIYLGKGGSPRTQPVTAEPQTPVDGVAPPPKNTKTVRVIRGVGKGDEYQVPEDERDDRLLHFGLYPVENLK